LSCLNRYLIRKSHFRSVCRQIDLVSAWQWRPRISEPRYGSRATSLGGRVGKQFCQVRKICRPVLVGHTAEPGTGEIPPRVSPVQGGGERSFAPSKSGPGMGCETALPLQRYGRRGPCPVTRTICRPNLGRLQLQATRTWVANTDSRQPRDCCPYH